MRFDREHVVGRMKGLVCSVMGHERDRDGWQLLHFFGVEVGEWITPRTPCAIMCRRCGEPIRWLVKENYLDGKIDQFRINGRCIKGTFDGVADYLCWPEPWNEWDFGAGDLGNRRQGGAQL